MVGYALALTASIVMYSIKEGDEDILMLLPVPIAFLGFVVYWIVKGRRK